MNIKKIDAYEKLGNQIRKKYGMEYDATKLYSNSEFAIIKESTNEFMHKYASAYSGEERTKGGHPNYDYLAEQSNIGLSESGSITAFYFDLKNFTKYFRLLDNKEKVYKAKAASIEAVASICYMYGGHLHEIPGDGVLFYFGGKYCDHSIEAQKALFALCDSMVILEKYIIPQYNSDDYPDIYPKMGLDFGEVLWGAYGSNPNYEVKATSFNVDIASKMLSYCNSKESALGDDFKKHLEIEEIYLTKNDKSYRKQLKVKGVEKIIDYPIWKFNWREYYNKEMSDNTEISNLSNPKFKSTQSRSILKDAPLA